MTALPHRQVLWPGKPARAPSRSKSVERRCPPGARASRPHALPLPAAQFLCDGAPGHGRAVHVRLFAATRLRAGPPRERGRLARIGPGHRVTNPARVDSPHLAKEWPWMAGCLQEQGCGRDARAPGGASSHDVVVPKEAHRPLEEGERTGPNSGPGLVGRIGYSSSSFTSVSNCR